MTPEENHMLARIHASISDLMDGGVTAAAIEAESERDTSVDYRAMWWNAETERERAESSARCWASYAKEQRIKANTRADQAEARIQAVRALHVASGPSGVICDACNVVTPCPTILALDSDGDPGQSCGRGPCALGYGHPGACRC